MLSFSKQGHIKTGAPCRSERLAKYNQASDSYVVYCNIKPIFVALLSLSLFAMMAIVSSPTTARIGLLLCQLHGSAASHWSTTAKNQWSTRFTSNGWRRCFHHAGFLVCSNLLGSSRPLSFPVPRALSSLFAFPLSPSVFSLSLPLMASSFRPPALRPRDLHTLASSVRPGIHARLLPFFPNSRH